MPEHQRTPLMRPINNRDTRMARIQTDEPAPKGRPDRPGCGDRSPTISIGRAYNL